MASNTVARAQAEQKDRPDLVQVVQRMQPEIARALPKHMDADRMARLALTVLRRDPKLARTSAESFCGALLTAAALGLEPGVNGEAYLVPFGDECTLIVGYQGFAKLFWQHPLAKHLDAQAVYENDDFDYAYGLEPFLRHRPARGARGAVTHYYAVASLTTGASVFEVMTPAEVAAVRAAALQRRRSGPQVDDPQHWMQRKTVLRQLVKRLPRSTSLSSALVVDERTGTELSANKVPEQITDGALDMPVDVDLVTGEVPLEGELVDAPQTAGGGGGASAPPAPTPESTEHAKDTQAAAAASWTDGK